MTDPAVRAGYPDLDAGITREVLAQLDEAGACAEHWKILITAGMGFFADAWRGCFSTSPITATRSPAR